MYNCRNRQKDREAERNSEGKNMTESLFKHY
jgi:hypothetical protein